MNLTQAVSNQSKKIITDMSIISASPDQVSSQIGAESVILNIKSGTYFGLNEVGSRIWNMIEKSTNINNIIQTLLDEYEVDFEQCKSEVLNLIDELISADLIEVENGKDSQIPPI